MASNVSDFIHIFGFQLALGIAASILWLRTKSAMCSLAVFGFGLQLLAGLVSYYLPSVVGLSDLAAVHSHPWLLGDMKKLAFASSVGAWIGVSCLVFFAFRFNLNDQTCQLTGTLCRSLRLQKRQMHRRSSPQSEVFYLQWIGVRDSCISMFLFSALCAGCAASPKTDDVSAAHKACYSYIYGENGFEKNYEKAFEWCTTAAEFGVNSAQTLLAELYLQGNGVKKDLETAAAWYEKAALQGHFHAQMMVFLVNNIYRREQSSPEEKAAGLLFLEEAVKAGYPKAIKIQQRIYGKEKQ